MDNVPTREANELRTGRPIIPPPQTGEVATEPAGGGTAAQIATGSSLTEALAGVAVVVLAIIALAGGIPWVLMSISVIILGAAMLFEGATTTARFARMLAALGPQQTMAEPEFGGGASAEFLGGVTGIVLGILALVGIYPALLAPIAVLVLGVVTLLSTGTNWRFSRMSTRRFTGGHEVAEAVTASMAASSCGTQVATGIAAVILTILAIIGLNPLILTLVALLCLGATVVVVGGAVGSRMFSLFRE